MSRLILTTLLITVVFSWEDLKRFLRWSAKVFPKQKHSHNYDPQADQVVGAVLVFALFPANLVYLLIGEDSLTLRLAVILSELLLIGFLTEITELFSAKKYRHSEVWTLLPSFLIGLFSPTFRPLSLAFSYRRLFGDYLRHLTIPILFGLGLKYTTYKYGGETILQYSDPLIITAISGVLVTMTIEILEKIFRIHSLRLFTYFRIVLGIFILFYLTRWN